MKVLVFGGTRFFGRHLVELLLAENHEVVVATRGITPLNFSKEVRHVQIDRKNHEDMMRIASENFDLVYDNICFSSQEALDSIEAFVNQNVRYIFTSSMAVYDFEGDLKESDFDPNSYKIKIGTQEDFTYGEGKRQAEAIFAQEASFECVFMRVPIVLGEDDYTQRLLFHIEKIQQKEPFYMPNPQAKMGFIRSDETARFLYWLGCQSHIIGPVNGASDGLYSMKELMEVIKEKTNGEILIET
ncbi:MAG: NAD-dependent epimerase/dehydratase family protein [Streptococcaceae bacterium]|jgi:nucleoside-diphosphate-sugar epimerase|nr:NAD-dependent epimerase/dehydratase family protein [Streptococcaceae bacterium]